jgi:hypothetical protein
VMKFFVNFNLHLLSGTFYFLSTTHTLDLVRSIHKSAVLNFPEI